MNNHALSELQDIGRLARDGRAAAVKRRDSQMVDFFQGILDRVLPLAPIPGMEKLK